MTAGTVTQAMQTYLLDLQAGGNYSTSPRMQQSKKIVNDWADAVTTTVNPLFNELQIFSSTLLGAGQPTTGPLATCASAIFSSWRLYAAQKSPVDDRQYYDLINSWVMTLINLQAQAMQMIQAANQYKCVGRLGLSGSTSYEGGRSALGCDVDDEIAIFPNLSTNNNYHPLLAHTPHPIPTVTSTGPPTRTSTQL